jgi:hypothetical protein
MITVEKLARAQVPGWLKENYGFSVSRATLDAFACGRGVGPRFKRMNGRTYYHVDDLREWAESRITAPAGSVSELREPVAA